MNESNEPRSDGNNSAASEPSPDAVGAARSAGQLLRQARLAKGMHIAALAAAIKVAPLKLEALEAERFDLLPDPTFARALALAVCRYLKIDPEPVLEKLPRPRDHRLEHINRGLATPFRDHRARRDGDDLSRFLRPALLAPLLLLVAALVVYVAPVSMWTLPSFGGQPSGPVAATNVPANSADAPPVATDEPASSGSIVAEAVRPSDSGVAPAAAGSQGAASEPSSMAVSPLTITATGESWVEVIDAQGRTLVSRSMPAGETVDLDGPAPLKLRIGNALGTQVMFRGQKVALAASTKDNVARLELK